MSDALRVLVVDDHAVLRTGLRLMLEREEDMDCVGEAGSAEEALRAVERVRPGLVLTDLEMPGMGGLEGVARLRERHPELPVLVLSMHDESLYAERALRAGAAGYIMKQEATEYIVEAIRQVLGGQVYLSDRMAARLLHRVENRCDKLTRPDSGHVGLASAHLLLTFVVRRLLPVVIDPLPFVAPLK